MKNVKDPIKEALFSKLRTALDSSVGLFYDYVPANLKTDNYVLITVPSSTDASTYNSADTNTSVQFGIYTSANENSGLSAKEIADAIYVAIGSGDINVEGFQITNFTLANDTDSTVALSDTAIFLNRFITYRYTIFHKN